MNILPRSAISPDKRRTKSRAGNEMTGQNILGTSYRHPHINNYRNMSRTRKSNAYRDESYTDGYYDSGLSPTSLARDLDRNLAKQGWQNHGNGVYINESTPEKNKNTNNFRSSPSKRHVVDEKNENDVRRMSPRRKNHMYEVQISPPSSPQTGLQRRAKSSAKVYSSPSSQSLSQISPQNGSQSSCHSSPRRAAFSISTKRRLMALASALGLALFGIFWDAKEVMNSTSFSSSIPSREWIMNLPNSFSSSALIAGISNTGDDASIAIEESFFSASMQEEWARVQDMTTNRAEIRRMRTKPQSYSTISAVAMAGSISDVHVKPEPAAPRLTFDLPSHRALDSVYAGHTSPNKIRRRLQESSPSNPCGSHAKEAAQLNPSHYPSSANIDSKSRVVVTGAFSQVGMELILQLHEQCGVKFILGIDSAYPNTRHDRVDLIEWRYNYIQRRVPGFQKLMVPVFGINPHPSMGEEVRFESTGRSFDLVDRFQPTHIVNMAGMEEGRGEHVDYGDTDDASPFANGGDSSMMRRFESLVSMDQILSSLAKFNDKNGDTTQPQLVHVSSNEAHDRSGVSMMEDSDFSASPSPATVYGTSCLLNEVLASYYHRHHGVDSVSLRVPTIYGPHARPGSLIYDLAERTVRNSIANNAPGIPKYHLDRDRYELSSMWMRREGASSGASEQVAFVSDVAQAVIAAMQFNGDRNSSEADRAKGPTMLRLGSKFTTSMKDLQEKMEGYLPPHGQLEAEASNLTENQALVSVYNDPAISIHDTERDRDLLGWTHTTRLHEGTKAMLAWHALKAYPFGIPTTLPSHSTFDSLIADSQGVTRSLQNLPCASGCRWQSMCSASAWDEVIDITKSLTSTCPYVIYTADLRPELVALEKHSTPSQRIGWEDQFCKVAFVSSSSKLAQSLYGNSLKDGTLSDWNGKRKVEYWNVIVLHGKQYSMTEAERSLAKLSPSLLFNDRVEKAMYLNHRKVTLTTDQAMGVMRHLEMNARDTTEKKIVTTDDHQEMKLYLPPRAHRHSVFFTNKYYFTDSFDTSNVKNLASFVMGNVGVTETKNIRAQVAFYEQSGHLTRTNVQRSANYQEIFQDNFFPYEFLRSTWMVHELKSEEGRNLRCEMYEEHSSWGNNGMEDLSMGFVLAKRKVKMQLGKMAAPEYEGPEEWYPLLVPREPGDVDAVTEGPVYLDYLESAQKVATKYNGDEFYISFLPQKRTA